MKNAEPLISLTGIDPTDISVSPDGTVMLFGKPTTQIFDEHKVDDRELPRSNYNACNANNCAPV